VPVSFTLPLTFLPSPEESASPHLLYFYDPISLRYLLHSDRVRNSR